MRAAVPPYFDQLIAGFWSGQTGRNVHLGYWDDPPALSMPCAPGEFEAAQARLTDILVGLADLADGQDVLDVGCGFGGTLEAVGKWRNIRRTGVNIDRRQLDICRSLAPNGKPLSLIAADACALPFRAASFDRVFCLEAMFHFRSRTTFLREAANVLRGGGRLVLSDILLRDPGPNAPMDAASVEAAIRREYGPWPQLWVKEHEIMDAAQRAGLELERVLDATRQTLPTYRVTAPQEQDGFPKRASAGGVLRWLHAMGCVSYLCLSFTKS
jgi:cyclopropane fatty-acyl-phospholipid synthase-like methyltransferase